MRLVTVRCLIFSVFILLCLPVQAIALPEGTTPEQAYEQGTLLYQQNKYTEARPYLDFATDNGYPAAALMMADTYWTNHFIATKKETEYAEKAAQMGSLLGLYRAGNHRSYSDDSDIWRLQLMSELKTLSQEGNALALRLMSAIMLESDPDESYDWMIKAAGAGDPASQHSLAIRYQDGKGIFLWPGKRQREIEKLLAESAGSEYRPAMLDYAYILKAKGDITGYQSIIDSLIEVGDASVLIDRVVHHDRETKQPEKVAYYAKIYLLSMGTESRPNSYDSMQFKYDQAIENLSKDEVSNIDAKAMKYISTHTVHYQKNIKDYEYTLESIKKLN